MPSEGEFPDRQQFVQDPSRPRYHFLPPANWMNDPNGLIQWQGEYHLFYQYNPDAAVHRNVHWGHASSPDLVHWRDWPIALAPGESGPDSGGIFSGCMVDHEGVPTAFYTGVRPGYTEQTQCMAVSHDGLKTWQKHPQNPLIKEKPAAAGNSTDFRDPFVWRGDDAWYMLVGSTLGGKRGTAFLYRSADMQHWDYLNPVFEGDPDRHGVMWECPNLFELDGKWILSVSEIDHQRGDGVLHENWTLYFVGSYENHRFTPETEGRLDYGYLYAPLTMQDARGRRLLWAWLREGRSEAAHQAAGWAGVQCIPRVLGLDEQLRLTMQPVPEIETNRGARYHIRERVLDGPLQIDAHGLALDIEAEVTLEREGSVTLDVNCSADGEQRTEISYDAHSTELHINRDHAPQSPGVQQHAHVARHPLASGEPLKLRILLDGSVLEVIANRRTSISSRIYPTRFEGDALQLHGTRARLISLNVYDMPSIWP